MDTFLSGIIKIGSLLSSGKPRTSTSDIKFPICFGSKLSTAAICLLISFSLL
ncbi:uncharacterized protein METZ01_LOCUS358067 [marine metagenome]|uniref:Uncharacterized protein n=1 Tax=marine metagenome TaxID=408172 RepID=A0A382S5Q3_9ZZZZ